ncbi:MAG: ATP-binding protein, partial [Planctomycetota bacterium]
KNFCSFADKATIAFEDIRKGIDTKNNMFCDSPAGARLSKVSIIVGPNASGKTSALKALAFLGWFVCNSFVGLDGEEVIPVDTFAFSEDKEKTSEFELIFEHKQVIYKYMLELCRTHVIREELYGKKKTRHFNYLFKRKWNPEKKSSDITQKIGLKTEVIKEVLRKNVSLIATSVAIKNEALIDIASYWSNIITNVNRGGKSWEASSLGDIGIFRATEEYSKNSNFFKKVGAFLREIDLGLEDISIEEVEAHAEKTGEVKKIHLPFGIHKINQKTYKLPFPLESNGTKNMYVLLHFLMPAIERGGTAVIDELEIDIHPHALSRIIELFANPITNQNNSQLLFTSHSLEILNHLEKEQINLVEKRDCKSKLYRLDELRRVVRRDDNMYAKYMAGAYGAVPNI